MPNARAAGRQELPCSASTPPSTQLPAQPKLPRLGSISRLALQLFISGFRAMSHRCPPPLTPLEILETPLPIVRIDAGLPLYPPSTISIALDTLPSIPCGAQRTTVTLCVLGLVGLMGIVLMDASIARGTWWRIEDDVEIRVVSVILQKLRWRATINLSGRWTQNHAIPNAVLFISPETLMPIWHGSVGAERLDVARRIAPIRQ